VLAGSRDILIVAPLATLVGIVCGTVLGLIAGYYGGVADQCVTRSLDVLFAFPAVLLALAVVSALGPSMYNAMLAITLVAIPSFARLVRASVLALRARSFVEAAGSLGATHARIVVRHILPNAVGPVIVAASLDVAAAIILESTLSFLGLGFPPDIPTWGRLLFDAKDNLDFAPHWALFPGTAIFLTVLSINFVGDGLRDALDPRKVL